MVHLDGSLGLFTLHLFTMPTYLSDAGYWTVWFQNNILVLNWFSVTYFCSWLWPARHQFGGLRFVWPVWPDEKRINKSSCQSTNDWCENRYPPVLCRIWLVWIESMVVGKIKRRLIYGQCCDFEKILESHVLVDFSKTTFLNDFSIKNVFSVDQIPKYPAKFLYLYFFEILKIFRGFSA